VIAVQVREVVRRIEQRQVLQQHVRDAVEADQVRPAGLPVRQPPLRA